MPARISAGNVSGSGKPPLNVMTSVAPARARMAVISPPPRTCARRASLALQSYCSRAEVICLLAPAGPHLTAEFTKCKVQCATIRMADRALFLLSTPRGRPRRRLPWPSAKTRWPSVRDRAVPGWRRLWSLLPVGRAEETGLQAPRDSAVGLRHENKGYVMTSAGSHVVFVHGLWLHATSWGPWTELFQTAGYVPLAPGWPGEPDTVEESRGHPELVAGKGIDDVVEHYAKIIRGLDARPVVIGHSFGGLIAQRLLGEDLAAAAVAIDAAPIKGVIYLPPSALRVASIALRNPANKNKAVALTPEQFRYGFGNALPARECA